ncbi:MAG: aldehyde dehydrogenase [Novosphingobium lindaniclasticum]|jgi:acyl-CoA reductase-like NAD-dependent aldehyde dehydrogenase|uniref:aldehyde dehydrogenase family protein n=1 Tax=Novosphingobium lindaniclasticum TaxID=1329895 RepID=UPI00240A8E54|nr:aldehyde dehydrogenase family protein [Novosphingobium lindaniclasticum]MDF2638456.1 aldehyde dehydrogenase [Novosphingobium lindaniclasticum]
MYQMLIDGELVDGSASLEVINPATGEAFATCGRAEEDDLQRAVAAARNAFPAWAALSWTERSVYLNALADGIEERGEEIAQLLTDEQGKPLGQARFEVGASVAAFRYFSAQEMLPRVVVDEPTSQVIEHYSPVGVVAAITPWNFPLILLSVKLAAALATGNTVVAKPAPTTPLSSLLVGEVAAATLPAGVLNVIVDANDLGGLLSAHPDVAKVTFTGSTATGKKVMQSAASSLKRLTLELGGNDAAILLDDVDIDDVAPKIFNAATFNAGQVCMAAKRIYAPRAKYDALCDALADLANSAVVGDGHDPATAIGPIQNQMQFDKVMDLIEDSRQIGTIVAGGQRLNRPGFFIAPTVVRDLPDSARLVQEEQFGPVIPVLAYDDIDEVIERANDSEFGLAGTVWGKDVERAVEVAMRVRTGTVWVNKHLDLRFDVAFGGVKQSGLGREQGDDGLREFVETRVVSVAKA